MTTVSEGPTVQVPAVAPSAKRSWWRRRRQLLAGLGALVLAGGAGIGIWLGTSGGGSPRSRLRLVSKTVVVRATRGTITDAITANGTIQPAQVSSLDFTVAGRVTAIDVTLGQTVAAGQVLATVAPTALEATEAGDQATLSAAQAKLGEDRSAGAAASQLAADQAAVVSAQAQLTTAAKAVAGADLTSPIAGTVSSLSLTAGEQVSGSGTPGGSAPGGGQFGPQGPTGSSGSASDQVTVVSTGQFVVDTTVDDTEVGEVKAGDRVLISPTSSGGPGFATGGPLPVAQGNVETFSCSGGCSSETVTAHGAPVAATAGGIQGTVATVAMAPVGTGIPSFPVTVDITGSPSGVYAGSGAKLSIIVSQLTGVVEVPTPAISYRRGGSTVTIVQAGGRRVTQPVSTGATSGGMTQVTHGLSAGEKVAERIETVAGLEGGGHGVRKSHSGPVVGNGFTGYAPLSSGG